MWGSRRLSLKWVTSNLTWVLGLELRSPGKHSNHLPMLSHLPSTTLRLLCTEWHCSLVILGDSQARDSCFKMDSYFSSGVDYDKTHTVLKRNVFTETLFMCPKSWYNNRTCSLQNLQREGSWETCAVVKATFLPKVGWVIPVSGALKKEAMCAGQGTL